MFKISLKKDNLVRATPVDYSDFASGLQESLIIPMETELNRTLYRNYYSSNDTEHYKMFHIPSKVMFDGFAVRFYGIVIVFQTERSSVQFIDALQMSSVDAFSHPHFTSFARGFQEGREGIVRMCTGGFSEVIAKTITARKWNLLGGVLRQMVSHCNQRSLASDVPSVYKCPHCGHDGLQNKVLFGYNRRKICSNCDIVITSDYPFFALRNDLPALTNLNNIRERAEPLWSDPWSGALDREDTHGNIYRANIRQWNTAR